MRESDQVRRTILVTGATGYIGGRLVEPLLDRGFRVRCLVRDESRLEGRRWIDRVEVVKGDVLDAPTLAPAMRGADVAYYLVHSLGTGAGFHERDLRAAANFAEAARDAGVARIVYLSGLGDASGRLSEHLRSRQETGDMLRASGVPVTEFRAGVIVGSGGLSFELIRYLTERLPVMICPRWVFTRTQPIGVREVLEYLVSALDVEESAGKVVQIGGADVVSYGEMMTIYAKVRGLRRWLLPVPVLTPRLSSLWVNLVTPIPGSIARPLIEGLRNESIVGDDSAKRLFPFIEPVSYRAAVERTLARLQASEVETTWRDALGPENDEVATLVTRTHEGMVLEQRQRLVAADPQKIFDVFTGLGGTRGWLFWNWAWQIRGFIDRLLGGVGLRRGRRDPDSLRAGDALDFWRVEAVEPGASLRLRAEMKVPGKAWLQFQVSPVAGGKSRLLQTAFFAPRGLAGWLYWYALYPVHRIMFSGLIDRIARRAER